MPASTAAEVVGLASSTGVGPAGAADWQAVAQGRLAELAAALDPTGRQTPARAAQILRQRARALAAIPSAPAGAEWHLLHFTRAGAAYAIPVVAGAAVIPSRGLVPLPGVPDAIAGVIHHRGALYTVVEPAALLETAGGPAGPGQQVVLLDLPGGRVGILADRIAGTGRVAEREVGTLEGPGAERCRGLVTGVAPGPVLILAAGALAARLSALVGVQA